MGPEDMVGLNIGQTVMALGSDWDLLDLSSVVTGVIVGVDETFGYSVIIKVNDECWVGERRTHDGCIIASANELITWRTTW